MSLVIFLIITAMLFILTAKVLLAFWVYSDARARFIESASIWALMTFFMTIATLLAFLIVRNRYSYHVTGGYPYQGGLVEVGGGYNGLSDCNLANNPDPSTLSERQTLVGYRSPYAGVGNNGCATHYPHRYAGCLPCCLNRVNGGFSDAYDYDGANGSPAYCRRCWRGLLIGAGVLFLLALLAVAGIIAIIA